MILALCRLLVMFIMAYILFFATAVFEAETVALVILGFILGLLVNDLSRMLDG